MKGKLKRLISIILAMSMVFSTPIFALAKTEAVNPILPMGIVYDGTQSSWAKPELDSAYDYGLTYPGVLNNFGNAITREEFCVLAVRLYERLTGEIVKAGDNPFTDTTNPEIIKAYNLKIVYGTSADKFTPDNNITRQEICVMIYRALDISISELDKSMPNDFDFTDKGKIADWAIDAVKFAYKNNIMKGTGNNEISPLLNTTREQAIVLLKRTYEQYMNKDSQGLSKDGGPVSGGLINNLTVSPSGGMKFVFPSGDKVKDFTTEEKKFREVVPEENLAFLNYDTRLQLFVSTTDEKPNVKPRANIVSKDYASLTMDYGAFKLPEIQEVKEINLPSKIETTIPKLPIKEITIPNLPFEEDTSLKLPSLIDRLKPNLPIRAEGAIYTRASRSAFIDVEGNQKRWFAFKLDNAAGAKKVIWQVSTAPFNGFDGNWKNPIGLVGSGEVPANSTEFQIDFANLKLGVSTGLVSNTKIPDITATAKNYKPIPQKQTIFYVRAVPVTTLGQAIGDPGEGIEVVYGQRVMSGNPNGAVKAELELWSSPDNQMLSTSGEFRVLGTPAKRDIAYSLVTNSGFNFFHFHNLKDEYKHLIIQVSTKKFPANGGSWPDTPDLVFEESHDLPTDIYSRRGGFPSTDIEYPATVAIDFKEFGKKASELKEGDYADYYVRGVALKPSINPGQFDAIYTDTVNVKYGLSKSTIQIYWPPTPPTKELKVTTAGVRIKSYTPAQWQKNDYLHHYYVFQEPKADEIVGKYKSATGEVLKSYYKYNTPTLGKNYPNHTKEQYEKEIIPKVLSVGTAVYFPPPEEKQKAWYEQLWDMVSGFFKDLVNVVKIYVNWVSETYAMLKVKLVELAVKLCPIESLKDEFKKAMEGLLNYGLMCLGIPPTLPNFDQLFESGVDYLISVALTEAGIPATEANKDIVKKIENEVENAMKEAAYTSDYNPVEAPFLKIDPNYLYRPAYVDIEIYNDSSVPSIAGSFNLDVTFEFNKSNMYASANSNGLILSHVNYARTTAGSSTAIKNASQYFEYFVYDLNGKTVKYNENEKAIYDIFKPVKGVKIPELQPGEKKELRVYLTPYASWPYGNDGAAPSRYPDGSGIGYLEFDNMYFKNGYLGNDFTHFEIRGHFPSPNEYLASEDDFWVVDDTQYFYKDRYKNTHYEKFKMPVCVGWKK